MTSPLLYPTLLQLALCLVTLPAFAIRHDLTRPYAFFGALLLSRRLHAVELWVPNSPPTCLQHHRAGADHAIGVPQRRRPASYGTSSTSARQGHDSHGGSDGGIGAEVEMQNIVLSVGMLARAPGKRLWGTRKGLACGMERDGRRPVKLVTAELAISELGQAMKDSHKADQNELVRRTRRVWSIVDIFVSVFFHSFSHFLGQYVRKSCVDTTTGHRVCLNPNKTRFSRFGRPARILHKCTSLSPIPFISCLSTRRPSLFRLLLCCPLNVEGLKTRSADPSTPVQLPPTEGPKSGTRDARLPLAAAHRCHDPSSLSLVTYHLFVTCCHFCSAFRFEVIMMWVLCRDNRVKGGC